MGMVHGGVGIGSQIGCSHGDSVGRVFNGHSRIFDGILGGSFLRSTASRERHQASRSNYERQLLHPNLPTLLTRWRLPPSASEPSRNCPPVTRSSALAFGSPRLSGRLGAFCCCIAQNGATLSVKCCFGLVASCILLNPI